jgi:tetratricopeptide (TPR) repeat protein
VLVIDQLEQIITQLRNKESKRLLAELREVLRDGLAKLHPPGANRGEKPAPPPFRLILSTQTDFVDVLRGVECELPLESLATYQLKALSRAQAERAIVKPGVLSLAGLATAPLAFDSSVVDRLIELLTDYGRRSEVEPLHIQLLCRDIEDIIVQQNREGMLGDTPVIPAFLSAENGLDQVLRDFYERQVDSLGRFWFKSKARALCERGLISRGEPHSLRAGSISKKFGLNGEELHRLLELRMVGLEGTTDSYRCNLAHPSLVEPVMQARKVRLAKMEGAMFKAGITALILVSTALLGYRGLYVPWQEQEKIRIIANEQKEKPINTGGTIGGDLPGSSETGSDSTPIRRTTGLLEVAMQAEANGDLNRAMRTYQQLLDQSPIHPIAMRRLVGILAENGQEKVAFELLDNLQRAITTLVESPDNADKKPAHQLALARVIEERARLKEKTGNLTDAFEGWQQAIKQLTQTVKGPKVPAAAINELVDANLALGQLYFQQRAYEQAEEAFTEVVLRAKDKTNGTLWRARARKSGGDLLGAIEDYGTIIRDHDQRASYFYERAETRFLMKDFPGALKDCFDSNLRDADNPLVYNLVGESYLETGDYAQAVEFFTNAIGLDPRLFRAYQGRAEAYLHRGQFDKAVEEFTRMIELQPHRHSAFGNRGLAYLKLRNLDEAIHDFSHVIQYYPDDALAYYNRGNAYSDKGDSVAALRDYTEAVRLRPNFARAFNNRGLLHLAEKNYELALADFSKAVELDSSYDFAYNNRGQTHHVMQQMPEAQEDYNTAIKINPKNDAAYFNRGTFFVDSQAFPKALDDLSRAIELNPNVPDYYRARAEVHEKMGHLKESEEDTSRANRLETERPAPRAPAPDTSEPRPGPNGGGDSLRRGESPLSKADLFQ